MDDIPTTADRSPAGEARRAEYAKITADPLFKNNPSALSAQADKVYGAPGTLKIENLSLQAGGSVEPAHANETPAETEARTRNEFTLSLLKTEYGADPEKTLAEGRPTYHTLSAGLEEPVTEIGSRIRLNYGPKGEAALVKFLAELEKIKQGG